MAITTTADLNNLFNLIYEDALFVAREQNIMTNLVTNMSATGWMARKITSRPQITAEAVAEGVDFANPTSFGKNLDATLTPGEVMAQVVLTDRDIDTDPDSARQDAATELGNAMGAKIDTDVASSFASFTTDKGPGSAQTATLAKFAAAIAVLRKNHVPNPIYIVIHPYQWHDVWVELGQPAATQALLGDIANEALRSYFVGSWINATWFTSTNVPAGTLATDCYGGVFNPQSIAFDSRKAPTLEPERDASLRAWELNISAGYAYGVRRATFGVKYQSDITEPA